jgi:hypothetical protein
LEGVYFADKVRVDGLGCLAFARRHAPRRVDERRRERGQGLAKRVIGQFPQHPGVAAGLGKGLDVAGELVSLDETVSRVPERTKSWRASSYRVPPLHHLESFPSEVEVAPSLDDDLLHGSNHVERCVDAVDDELVDLFHVLYGVYPRPVALA